LQDLWRARQVRDADLPWLLNRIEQPLRHNDYPPNFLQHLMLIYSIVFGLLAAGFGSYVFYVFFAPSAKLYRQSTDARKWLGLPVQLSRGIYVQGELPIIGMLRLSTPVTPPASLRAGRHDDTRSILAVVQAGSEKRLALVTGQSDLIKIKNASGMVILTLFSGIPETALSELRKSYPDLNTDTVFCIGWELPYTVPRDYSIAPVLGAVSGLLFLISLSVYLWWRRRRQSQIEAWLDLLRARSAGVTA